MPMWLWWFLFGALVAWLVEWLIDWQYWRVRLKKTLTVWDSSSTMRERMLADPTVRRGTKPAPDGDGVAALRAALADAQQQAKQHQDALHSTAEALAQTRAALAQHSSAAQTEAEHLRARIAELEHAAPVVAAPPASFNTIPGISPTFEKRLHDAGVTSFAQLAAQTPTQVRKIVRPGNRQIKPETWIATAQQLARAETEEPAP